MCACVSVCVSKSVLGKQLAQFAAPKAASTTLGHLANPLLIFSASSLTWPPSFCLFMLAETETGVDVVVVVLVVPVAESLIKLRNSARMRRQVVLTKLIHLIA